MQLTDGPRVWHLKKFSLQQQGQGQKSSTHHSSKPLGLSHTLCQHHNFFLLHGECWQLLANQVFDALEQLHIIPEKRQGTSLNQPSWEGLSCHHSQTAALISSPQILWVCADGLTSSSAASKWCCLAWLLWFIQLISVQKYLAKIFFLDKYFSVYKSPPKLFNLHYIFKKYINILYSPVINCSVQWMPTSRIFLDFPPGPPWVWNSLPFN